MEAGHRWLPNVHAERATGKAEGLINLRQGQTVKNGRTVDNFKILPLPYRIKNKNSVDLDSDFNVPKRFKVTYSVKEANESDTGPTQV
jgi:hypothetical protein